MATTGRVGYVRPMPVYPVNHPGNDPDVSNLDFDWRDVAVEDARMLDGGPTLARNGFTTLPNLGPVDDWEQPEARARIAAGAIAALKRVTGAREILPLTSGGRFSGILGPRSTSYARNGGPLTFIHNDYNAGSAPRHLAEDYPDRAGELLSKRFAIYNMWHLVSPPPQDWPLALCDPRSIMIADIVPSEARSGTKHAQNVFGENVLLRYNPAHRWYYYPDLRTDETLVWAGFDSDPRFPSIVPHCAFADPAAARNPTASRSNVHGSVYALFD